MRALCWHGKGDVRFDTVPDPRIEDPTDVIIKVTSTCIRGGDPDSVHFCHKVGMDYVSCSPFRVPIARLAAAQAALGEKAAGNK